MTPDVRDMRISRRSWLLAGLAIPLFRMRAAEIFHVTFDGDNLYPVAPSLNFLSGKPLARLKDANAVVFASQFTLFSDDRGTIFRQKHFRFIVSYSIWEETFKVTIPDSPVRSREGLSMAAAEAWCLDSIAISASGLVPDRPFWLRFELRTVKEERDLLAILGDSALSISAPLIDFFSRKPGSDDKLWSFTIPRLRLADMPRPPGRRAPF
jgi:hypothetical protein